jgi:hypothetical protein
MAPNVATDSIVARGDAVMVVTPGGRVHRIERRFADTVAVASRRTRSVAIRHGNRSGIGR